MRLQEKCNKNSKLRKESIRKNAGNCRGKEAFSCNGIYDDVKVGEYGYTELPHHRDADQNINQERFVVRQESLIGIGIPSRHLMLLSVHRSFMMSTSQRMTRQYNTIYVKRFCHQNVSMNNIDSGVVKQIAAACGIEEKRYSQ